MSTNKRSILLTHKDFVQLNNVSKILTLPHPKCNYPILFLFDDQLGHLYELQKVNFRKFNSWFIDQNVSSDSFLYTATKYDPRFILLPFFEKFGQKFSPLEQIIDTSNIKDCSRLDLSYKNAWKIDEICDINDKFGDDMILYRLNQEKSLNWLKNKVINTSKILAKQRIEKLENSNKCFVDTFNVSFQSIKPNEDSGKCKTL